MRLFQKKFLKRLNNKGLTMVELICAVAIVSILGTCISGFMVVGANSYRSGSAETQVQQEAQLVANQIDDLIIDSTASVTFSGGELIITQADKSQSKVTYDATNKALYYMAYTYNTTTDRLEEVDSNGAQLMAEGVESFTVQTSDFQKNGNIKINMQVSSGTHVYPAYFTITSRNKSLSPEEVSYTKKAKVVANIRKWLLEPNQSYDFSSHASAIDKNGITRDVVWSIVTTGIDTNTQFVDNGAGKISKLQIGKDETKSVVRIKASFTEDGETAERYIDVYIRRVNSIYLEGFVTTPVNTQYKAGATYKLMTAFDGTSLNRVSGAAYDSDYVDTRSVSFAVTAGDATAIEIYQNAGVYYARLKRDMASGESITIRATSLHANGTNKSHQLYATVTDDWTLTSSILNLPISWVSSFRRGDDSPVHIEYSDVNAFVSEKLNVSSLPSGSTITWFARFKEEGGSWTKYTVTDQSEFTNFKVNANETLFFKIEKAYSIDFAAIIYNASTKTIYWPVDNDLINNDGFYNGEAVAATGFEGWTIDPQYSKKTSTAKGEYSTALPIGASRYYFGQNTSLGMNDAFSASAGTIMDPITIPRNTEISLTMHDEKTVGIKWQKGHSISLDIANMEYWNGTAWVPATAEQKAGVSTQEDNQMLKIKNNDKTSGIFRAGVYVTNYGYKEYDPTATTVLSKIQGTSVAAGTEFTKGRAYSFEDGTGVVTFALPEKPKPVVEISMTLGQNQNNAGQQAYKIVIANKGTEKIESGSDISIVVEANTGIVVKGLNFGGTYYTATSLGSNKYEIVVKSPTIDANGSQERSDQYFTLDGTFDKTVQQLTITTK